MSEPKTREVFWIARLNLRVTKWHKPPPWFATRYQPAIDDGREWWNGNDYEGAIRDWYKDHLIPTVVKA